MMNMGTLKAVVKNGRAIIEEAVDYPDGTELELRIVGLEDEMSPDELARFDSEVDSAYTELKSGKGIPAARILERL